MNTNSSDSKSRLAKHMQIMGLDSGNFSEEELKAEKQGIESMRPSALNLDGVSRFESKPSTVSQPIAKKRQPFVYAAGGMLLAACVAFLVFRPTEPTPLYLSKGPAKVKIYEEVDGVVKEWDRQEVLENGTRLRLELKAMDDTSVFVGILNKDNENLISPSSVFQKKLQISAGQVAAVPGSIELTGANEGETFFVVSCQNNLAPADEAAFSKFWRAAVADHASGSFGGCSIEKIRLR